MKCDSDTGECSGVINGDWCERRYPWAIKNDGDMLKEFLNDE